RARPFSIAMRTIPSETNPSKKRGKIVTMSKSMAYAGLEGRRAEMGSPSRRVRYRPPDGVSGSNPKALSGLDRLEGRRLLAQQLPDGAAFGKPLSLERQESYERVPECQARGDGDMGVAAPGERAVFTGGRRYLRAGWPCVRADVELPQCSRG